MFAVVFLTFYLFRFVQNRLCFGISGTVCCDGYLFNQTTGHCQKCPVGYYLNNCSKLCSPPNYGEDCQSICQCPYTDCHFATGCPQHVKTVTGVQRLSSSVEDTAQHKTFSLTVTTPFLTVSYTTEGRGLSPSVNKQDVTQTTEIGLFKNEILVHAVQVILSLIGVFVIVFTIFVITYIYFKCFRKTTNDGEMNKNHLKAQYTSIRFDADDTESRIQPEQEEPEGTDCTYLTPVYRPSDNSDTSCSDEIVEIFKETPLNRQKNRYKPTNNSNFTLDAEQTNVYIEILQDNVEILNLDGACHDGEKYDIQHLKDSLAESLYKK